MPPSARQYPGFDSTLLEKAQKVFSEDGFQFSKRTLRGCLFTRTDCSSSILLDHLVCDDAFPYEYNEYTKEQNAFMHEHEKLFRFLVDDAQDIKEAGGLLKRLLSEDFSDDVIKTTGRNRELAEIDPTMPEACFEQAFIDCFGRNKLNRLNREFPIIDINGVTRWVDYYIRRHDIDIAIEKNGEAYHHPLLIGKARYKNQLLKQNSLVAYNAKVFRWSLQAMKFTDNFLEEMRLFLGDHTNFILSQKVAVSRPFKLFQHQSDALEKISQERLNGQSTFLIVLPTGTGKTEIFIADFARQLNAGLIHRALLMVPSKQLKFDHIENIKARLNDYGVSNQVSVGEDTGSCILAVQTYSWLSRHYQRIPADFFDYIAVDEAHHSMAPTVQKVIRHFRPTYLLGVTATNERLDEKKLETIFGQYNTDLGLFDAIKQGLLTSIKAFRIKSNIDLSEVRYNGKDYMAADLQNTVIVPSRDQLIVDVLQKYFVDSTLKQKQGIIFCVSVNHAVSLAKRMQDQGLSAKSVSGKKITSASYIQQYQEGKIQFLTTCSLLNEGWDSPQTSIIVMARPTMSKVLYTQQIGRGTRKAEGKEALYVIDVVDNYGGMGNFNNKPWSIHALLGISAYLPWGSLLGQSKIQNSKEEIILAGLYEQERAIEQIDIFTFENIYSGYINDEQLARDLFVSTGTVKSWVRRGKIAPQVTVPLGRSKINYFAPGQVNDIIRDLNLSQHDENTQHDDFFEFIDKEDFSMSYKMVMLLSMLKVVNNNGECGLDDLLKEYAGFYKARLEQGLRVDRPNCPYAQNDVLQDRTFMKRSLLQNPFEKFERKRFMYHCKDLNHISFSNNLWNKINTPKDLNRLKISYFNSLVSYYEKLDGLHEEAALKFNWKIPDDRSLAEPEAPEEKIIKLQNMAQIKEAMFKNALPFVGDIAAGEPFMGFAVYDLHSAVDDLDWIEVPETLCNDRRFLIRVAGKSMEPTIMKGDYLVCEYHRHRQQNRDVVIMGDFSVLSDGEVAVKRISESEHHWIFKSDNPQYDDILLDKGYDEQYPILGTVIYNLTRDVTCH